MASHFTEALADAAENGELPCARAFETAGRFAITPAATGQALDRLKIHITRCQLGLFGYRPEKRAVTPRDPENPALIRALSDAAQDGRISCRSVWDIAAAHSVSRRVAGDACEFLGLKIKPCQLGAF